MRVRNAIWSLKYPVTINKVRMTLFDARDRGLIELNFDPHWRYYSYRVISTGQVVSFYSYGFNPVDWSEWYREAITKGAEVAI